MLNKVPRGEGIRTLCADVLRTALPGAQADAVLLCDVLHHLTDQPALIAETLRLVRPGGKLLIYDFDRSHPLTRVVETFESVFLPPVMFQTAGGIEALLSEAGWTPFHTRVEGPLFFGLWRAP